MKKSRTLIILLGLIFLLAVGCSNNKESNNDNGNESETKITVTGSSFSSIMQESGYEIIDALSMLEDGSAKVAKVAKKNDILIQFYIFSTEDQAINHFTKYEQIFSDKKGTGDAITESGKNFNRYLQTANGYYSVSIRIDNTFIYTDVKEEYKNEIATILEKLNY